MLHNLIFFREPRLVSTKESCIELRTLQSLCVFVDLRCGEIHEASISGGRRWCIGLEGWVDIGMGS